MNIPNNKRKKDSQDRIEKIFINLLQTKNVNEISVSEIVKLAKVNRSTFYANYIDIYDLVEKVKERMINEFFNVYIDETISATHSYNFLKLFNHIKNNQIFYKTFFKLNFDYTWNSSYLNDEMIKWFGTTENMDYHIIFFKAGLNAIIQKWLDNNCKESPEEIERIIKNEYAKRTI